MKKYEYLGMPIEIPDGYEWVAMNRDGSIYVYEEEPNELAIAWFSESERLRLPVKVETREYWENTLRHVSDLPYVEEQPETSQQDKPMTTLPAGTAVTINGETHYLAEEVAVPTTTEPPKTAEELAQEWWVRIAPEGDNRFKIDRYGVVDRESDKGASDFANTWPSRAIAERRANQIKAQNLLILAAMECNAEHPCDRLRRYYIRYSRSEKNWEVICSIEHPAHSIGFNRRLNAEEAMEHLRALGLLDYLVLDMEAENG